MIIIRSPGKNSGRGQFDLEAHLSESYVGKIALQQQRSRKGWPNQSTDLRGPGQDLLTSIYDTGSDLIPFYKKFYSLVIVIVIIYQSLTMPQSLHLLLSLYLSF